MRSSTERSLLWLGILAPVLFFVVFTLDGIFKLGYSAFDEAISYLEVGENGGIQRATFIVLGLLLIGFTVAYARWMRPILRPGWSQAGATFLVLSNLGYIMAGLFVPDPYLAPQTSTSAVLHYYAYLTVFLPFGIADLILGGKLAFTRGWRGYGCYSLLNGILMSIPPVVGIIYLFAPTIVNPNSPGGGLTNRIALAVFFAWYVVTALRLLARERARAGSLSRRRSLWLSHPSRAANRAAFARPPTSSSIALSSRRASFLRH